MKTTKTRDMISIHLLVGELGRSCCEEQSPSDFVFVRLSLSWKDGEGNDQWWLLVIHVIKLKRKNTSNLPRPAVVSTFASFFSFFPALIFDLSAFKPTFARGLKKHREVFKPGDPGFFVSLFFPPWAKRDCAEVEMPDFSTVVSTIERLTFDKRRRVEPEELFCAGATEGFLKSAAAPPPPP